MNAAAGTVLAFDYGTKQIGIAVRRAPLDFATPLTVLRSGKESPRWDDIETILHEWQPAVCVVGLPVNMDGSESELASKCRRFARQLEGRFAHLLQFRICLQDERLSSHEAKEMLAEGRGSPASKNAAADSLAAKVILERWLAVHTP